MNMDEIIRRYNEQALQAGKERVSEQTGFLHHHYHIGGTPRTIPLLENFIYAYALLKNRSVESIQTAKDLLEKLLRFQCTDEGGAYGNFPIYLHEYPDCKDRLLSINILPVFFWAITQFSTVLGSELLEKMRQAVAKLVQHSVQTRRKKPLPYALELKLAAFISACETKDHDYGIPEAAHSMISDPQKDQPNPSWFSPSNLGDIFVSLQMIGPSISGAGWPLLWEHVRSTYHPAIGEYIGPGFHNYHQGQHPAVTLYDYFMASTSRTFPKKLEEDSIIQLHAALIQAHDNRFPDQDLPYQLHGNIEGKKWSLLCDDYFSVSTLDHKFNKLESLWKSILPMHLLASNGETPISLVAQGGNYDELKCSISPPNVFLEYNLPSEVDLDHKEEKKEVVLSVTRTEHLSFLVNGGKSNTFQLGDEVSLLLQGATIKASFELVSGKGRFIGHIMPGNRASQLALKNGNRFNAFDWQLFLRTLARSGQCRIRVTLTVQRSL